MDIFLETFWVGVIQVFFFHLCHLKPELLRETLMLGAGMGDPTHDKVMQDSRKSLGHLTHDKVMQKSPDEQGLRTRWTPWTCSSIYPQTRICLSYYFMSFTSSSDISRGLSLTKRVNLGL